jgi:hypothetical protein
MSSGFHTIRSQKCFSIPKHRALPNSTVFSEESENSSHPSWQLQITLGIYLEHEGIVSLSSTLRLSRFFRVRAVPARDHLGITLASIHRPHGLNFLTLLLSLLGHLARNY